MKPVQGRDVLRLSAWRGVTGSARLHVSRSLGHRVQPIAYTWLTSDGFVWKAGRVKPVCHAHSLAGLQVHEDIALQIAAALTGASAGFALFCICMLGIWQFRARPVREVPRQLLHGVDITGTAYIDRPGCLRAANFAARAHAGRYRKTGDPYVRHCVETAVITEQMMLHLFDPSGGDLTLRRAEDCIVTALLHDIVDDSDCTLAEVRAAFGADVASLVGAVAQLSRNNQLLRRAHRRMLAQGERLKAEAEVEAMKSMILQSTDEPMVIIVKLADRLHNMRTVWALKPEKAQALAQETLQVWCPMCEYLGLGAFKAELEDICFAVLQPVTFQSVYDARETMLTQGTGRSRKRKKTDKTLGPRRAAQVHSSHLGTTSDSGSDDEPAPSLLATRPTAAGNGAAVLDDPPPRSHAAAATVGPAATSAATAAEPFAGAVSVQQRVRTWHPSHSTAKAPPGTARSGDGGTRLSDMLPEGSRHSSADVPGIAPHFLFHSATRRPEGHAGGESAGSHSTPQRHGEHTNDDARARLRGVGDLVGAASPAAPSTAHARATESSSASDCEYDDGGLWYDALSAQQLAQCMHDVGTDEHFRFQATRTVDGVITPAQPADPSCGFSAAQTALRHALGVVIPFRSNNFMTRHEDHRPPGELSAAMRFADACASQLMGEIQVEGIGAGLTIQIQGRVKSLYSTHKKMQLKGVPIDQVYDSFALRVVVSDGDGPAAPDPIMTCYRIPPVAYRLWSRVQAEYDDYITRPKGSGYRSIHLAVLGPGGVPLEVQVRTASMHYAAEYGPASHWAYKDRMRATLLARSDATQAPPSSSAAGSGSSRPLAALPRPVVSGPLPRAAMNAITSGAPALGGRAAADSATSGASAGGAAEARPRSGQPVICVDEGRICDGVVLDSDDSGGVILVAMTKRSRWAPPCEPSGPLLAAEYEALLTHARAQGWSAAGQQNQALEVREFRRRGPGTYVYVDRFGQPGRGGEHAKDGAGWGAAGKMDVSGVKGGKIGRWEMFRVAGEASGAAPVDEERVVRLRAALEWGAGAPEDAHSMPASRRELFQLTGAQELLARTRAGGAAAAVNGDDAAAAAAAAGGEAAEGMMKVLVYMVGIAEVPRGSTAADMVRLFGRVEISAEGEAGGPAAAAGERLLNVNNVLVPEDTVLLPGDLVVLSSQLLSNV
eukprot:jgi/Ulvmu1/6328/UM029_0036.1